MELKEAVKVIKPMGNGADELRVAYRLLCKQYHPDINPDGIELMKTINHAYEVLKKNLGRWSFQSEYVGPSILDSLQEFFNKIKNCQGIAVEVCGSWMWVTGNTFAYRELFKTLGMKFAGKKKAWYWHPPDNYRKRSKRVFDLDEIRTMFGSESLETEAAAGLSG